VTPDLLSRAGRALFGSAWKQDFARHFLSGKWAYKRIGEWLDGRGSPPPGVRADIARELRRRATECAALADEIEAGVATLHGLTRRELVLIGWLLDGRRLLDGPRWLSRFREPAQVLWREVLIALDEEIAAGRATLAEGEREHLDAALSALSDAQALEVIDAAYTASDLEDGVPDN
jgi:hypothetical protein